MDYAIIGLYATNTPSKRHGCNYSRHIFMLYKPWAGAADRSLPATVLG